MQIAAMRQKIRGAKLLFGCLTEDHVEFNLAGAPVPVVPRTRIKCLGPESGFEAQLPQHLHRVAADLNSRSEPRELWRLLIHRCFNVDAAKGSGCGEAAHARANNCY